MATEYKGWKVPEEIIIVAKECRIWDHKESRYITDNTYQGYVVDANNKDMLASAHSWAKWTEYVQPYDKETHTYKEVIEHTGVEHRFKNEGFTLELLETAKGSSQGGKLSFWNCKVSKDGKEFIIGIASDYLLDILKYNDFKCGVCQATLSFARCKGGVGMMNKEMPIYQEFLKDEELRASMSKGKTKKRIPGHLYSTLTGGDVYFGKFYQWYKPVYEESQRYYGQTLRGFKRLTEPEVLYWSPLYDSRFTKMSEYAEKGIYFSQSNPARTDSGQVAEIDITLEDVLDKLFERLFAEDNHNPISWVTSYVGISTSNTEYTMPDMVRKCITDNKLFIVD